MVNVDFASPSLLLGTALIGCGVMLLNMRNFENKVSRDADIVVAAMVSIVGSTLIFQGWRLDPLLLLCQALTTSVAFWYGVETFRLRSKEADMAARQLLPPPEGAPQDLQQQQQFYQGFDGQASSSAPYQSSRAGSYLPPGQDAYYPWGSQQQQQQGLGEPQWNPANNYAETIQYDYYGNPILQQQDQQGPAAPLSSPSAAAGGQYDSPPGPSGMWPGGLNLGPQQQQQQPGAGPSYAMGGYYASAAPPETADGMGGTSTSMGQASPSGPYALPPPRPSTMQLPQQQQQATASGPLAPVDPQSSGGGGGGGRQQQQASAAGAAAAGGAFSAAGAYDSAVSAAADMHDPKRQGNAPAASAGGRLGLYDGAVDDWE